MAFKDARSVARASMSENEKKNEERIRPTCIRGPGRRARDQSKNFLLARDSESSRGWWRCTDAWVIMRGFMGVRITNKTYVRLRDQREGFIIIFMRGGEMNLACCHKFEDNALVIVSGVIRQRLDWLHFDVLYPVWTFM